MACTTDRAGPQLTGSITASRKRGAIRSTSRSSRLISLAGMRPVSSKKARRSRTVGMTAAASSAFSTVTLRG
jgi:hypothetical protein